MPPTLLLSQHINLTLKIGMRSNRTRQRNNLATLNIILTNTPQQQPNIVPSLTLIKQLTEHLNTSHRRLLHITQTNNLNLLTNMDNTSLNTTSHHRATTSNRKHILNRHHERLLSLTQRLRNIRINSLHQIQNRLLSLRITLQSLQSRTTNHRNIVTRELILSKQIPHLKLNQIQQLLIINLISLIHIHNDVRNTNLTSQQHMLTSLRHRTISSRNHQNRTINLSSTRNHVLHIISMTRHINMRIMTILRLILHMRNRNRDTTLPLLRSLINIIKRSKRRRTNTTIRQHLRNRSRQRRLPMINMTHRPNIHMRLGPLEFRLSHLALGSLCGLRSTTGA